MIAEERTGQAEQTAPIVWCYLVSLGGQLFGVPDDDRTVILPYISAVPQVTPLPTGLAPAYVLGLINVAQRGELLLDLPRLMRLRDGPLPASLVESRRVVVIGEAVKDALDGYRLAFAVDYGYELTEATRVHSSHVHARGAYVQDLLDTPRGEAALLNMEVICNTVLQDMDATRFWNQPEPDAAADVEDL